MSQSESLSLALPNDRLPAAADPSSAAALLGPHREAEVFWRLRRSIVSSMLRRMFQTARLRISLVVLLSGFFWCGLLVLFLEGFRFLAAAYSPTIHGVYNIFFASLMMMLVFSTGIILYSGLFRSAETAFLLTTPARTERIFLHKFQEAIWFSSWGFVLLGSPMLVAYGIIAAAPWHYFALLLPFMLAFAYIPGGLGALACLLIVYCAPRIRIHLFGLFSLLTVVAAGLLGWSIFSGVEYDLLTPRWFQEMSGRLKFAEQRLLPSWWLSAGLLEASRRSDAASMDYHPWAHSVMFLAVLISNAMMCQMITVWTAGRLYRGSYSRLHGDRPFRKRIKASWLDRAASRVLSPFPPPIRLLLVKDFRLFRRDPVQWSQFLIFFGLLGLYFINIRRFSYDINYLTYVNMIGFLNLGVVGLILSTFTTRFIFPMISLEGRRFWILGLLPVNRDTILWGKFFFAAGGTAIPCVLLILLSDLMLGLPAWIVLIHQGAALCLCLGLAGIAVGLGAKMPDLRQSCPSKIAAGFGGTLNLVVSAFYIIVVVVLTAMPCHMYLVDDTPRHARLIFAASSLVLGIAIAATVLPLRMGFKAFQTLEF